MHIHQDVRLCLIRVWWEGPPLSARLELLLRPSLMRLLLQVVLWQLVTCGERLENRNRRRLRHAQLSPV